MRVRLWMSFTAHEWWNSITRTGLYMLGNWKNSNNAQFIPRLDALNVISIWLTREQHVLHDKRYFNEIDCVETNYLRARPNLAVNESARDFFCFTRIFSHGSGIGVGVLIRVNLLHKKKTRYIHAFRCRNRTVGYFFPAQFVFTIRRNRDV